MSERKDLLYIFLTVLLFGIIALYLAFTQGQSLSSIISIPFRGKRPTVAPSTVPVSVSPVATETVSDGNEGSDYFAVFKTNFGDFEVDLFDTNAPNSVKSFVYLAESRYYDTTSFHYYIPNLLIQGGSRNTLTPDRSDDKLGNPGYTIKDEINWDSLNISEERRKQLQDKGYESNTNVISIPMDKYVIAWANSEPNNNGSQFFIVLANKADQKVSDLEGKHTVFGKVVKGTEVLDAIAQLPVNLDILDEPRTAQEVVISSIKIEKR